MATRRYSSFEEIDERLKILKLQQEIHKESLKLNFARFKNRLYPLEVFGGVKGVLQKVILTFAIKKSAKLFRRARTPALVE